MSFSVTRCPACESTFNTNSRVLAAAAGRVRCGACLNVFEATDKLLDGMGAKASADESESVFVGNDPQQFFDPSHFFTRSSLTETGTVEPEPEPEDEQVLHGELEQAETLPDDFFVTVAAELQAEKGKSLAETDTASLTGAESTEAIRARALKTELQDEEALEAIPRENLAALGKMSPPLELPGKRESRWLRSTGLFLTILLLGAALSAQYLWQHRQPYSQVVRLRPLYEFGCTYLNCTLPEYSDIQAIRSDKLTVQTHPEIDNGLMVTTVIRNTSAFPQAFPVLLLGFNSAENTLIALREFAVSEYLDPDLHSFRLMPSMMPVQINLAIMDPGPEAVNYTLAFRLP